MRRIGLAPFFPAGQGAFGCDGEARSTLLSLRLCLFLGLTRLLISLVRLSLCLVRLLIGLLGLFLCLFRSLSIFLSLAIEPGLLFRAHSGYSSFLGSLGSLSCDRTYGLLILMCAVIIFCLVQQHLCMLQNVWGVLLCVCITRNANSIPCFQ